LSNLFFSLFADPSVFSEKNVPVSAGFRRLDVSASVPEFLSKSFGWTLYEFEHFVVKDVTAC
jgi:hypothetical protein